ncbi:histidine phosphatase family protein, partial [Nocardioides sp.]|uniref:histidine phosphatase family protein n=1 Tax=Nocardioides sp. TaxID=35761 RepID=UPI0035635189
TEQDVGILEELREVAGESLAACRDRVVPAIRRVLEVHADEDVVLIGHATAWALVAAAVSGAALDLDRWQRLSHPGLVVLEV